MRGFVKFIGEEKRYYLAAIFRLAVAIIFLMFGNAARHPRVVWFFGLLFLIGGILVLVVPAPKIKSMIDWWIAKPLWVYRLWGVVAVLIGVLIIYAGWPATVQVPVSFNL
jgi:uncharacterized protein YjeT (DUF2065 family)